MKPIPFLLLCWICFFSLDLPAAPTYSWNGSSCDKEWLEDGVVRHERLQITEQACDDLADAVRFWAFNTGRQWENVVFRPNYLAWWNENLQAMIEFTDGKYTFFVGDDSDPIENWMKERGFILPVNADS